MGRAGQWILLVVSLLFVAAGIGMVATGADGGWPALLFFGMCAGVAVSQLWPDLLRGETRSPADLRAAFPGPVVLRMDRRRIALLLLGAAILFGVPLWMLLRGEVSGPAAWVLWACTGLTGLAVLVLALLTLSGGTLTLTEAGFELRRGWSRSVTPWEAVGEFAIGRVGPTRTPLVVFRDERKAGVLADANVALTGRDSALSDAYGLSHEELAQLLNAWRERALAGR